MSASKPSASIGINHGVMVISYILCLASGGVMADVTVYEKAPTVEELQQKLLGGGKAEQKKFKTRAIVFGDSAPGEAAPAQLEATPSASYSSPAQPVATQPTGLPQPPTATQTLQVSENAIAFPIQFKVNSAQIQPESVPFLQSIAGLMQKDPSIRLLVEGHTDMTGNYQRNMALSRERAFAVMNYLIDRFGIEPTRLVPVGKGPTDLLPGLDPADPKHRRVQFRTIG